MSQPVITGLDGGTVLIESDWNLKLLDNIRSLALCPVLIESDWNLKPVAPEADKPRSRRINRIRLEFKASLQRRKTEHWKVLIESDWNLKTIVPTISPRASGINRIRLEFKENNGRQVFSGTPCINRIRLEFKDAQSVD